jgi:hypothetical protein
MADLPLGRVHVRVVWNARVFPAVRALHPATRKLTWCEYRNGEIVWLPPKPQSAHAVEWSPEPERWQPLDRSKWGQPLPEPLPVQVEPQWSYEKVNFGAVADADVSDLAREMERDRADARAGRQLDQEEPSTARWWLDVTNIRYEPCGSVTQRMAEGRVLRALAWCGAGRDLTLRTTTVGAVLTRMAEVAEKAAEGSDTNWHGLTRFQALPRDQEDFAAAMAWFTALNPPENWHRRRRAWSLNRTQQVMLMRTLTIPLSWADIGHKFSISGTRCQQIYAKGMEACWRVANGGQAFPGRTITDQIAALQDRNRTWKRSATA